MNYIKHLSAAFEIIYLDYRLQPSHISLYFTLFQFWNLNRFENPISISRKQILKQSKIGSKSTYHRKIHELNKWKYIKYIPSHNPVNGSKIFMFNFDTYFKEKSLDKCPNIERILGHLYPKNERHSIQKRTTSIPPMGSSKTYINNKHKTIYKNFENVSTYFLKNKSSKIEAKKFFNYYESIGWKIGGKIKIKNWQAVAQNWLIKAHEIKKNQTKNEVGQKLSKLHVNNNKDYGIPL